MGTKKRKFEDGRRERMMLCRGTTHRAAQHVWTRESSPCRVVVAVAHAVDQIQRLFPKHKNDVRCRRLLTLQPQRRGTRTSFSPISATTMPRASSSASRVSKRQMRQSICCDSSSWEPDSSFSLFLRCLALPERASCLGCCCCCTGVVIRVGCCCADAAWSCRSADERRWAPAALPSSMSP